MNPRMRDLVIVGAGPAGLAAAVHAVRAGLDHLVLERGEPGGLLRAAHGIDNLPTVAAGTPGLTASMCGPVTASDTGAMSFKVS